MRCLNQRRVVLLYDLRYVLYPIHCCALTGVYLPQVHDTLSDFFAFLLSLDSVFILSYRCSIRNMWYVLQYA